jgi:phospho-N-acetylmuramoyl-pentapeptide-transferase
MLYHLLYPLHNYFGPFNLFRYITFRAAYAAAASILICLIAGPWVIRKIRALQLGQRIREEVPERHQQKSGTPSMGGILILISIIVSVLLFADLTNPYIYLGLLTIIWLGALGFWDDYVKIKKNKPRGISKSAKFAGQISLALLIGAYLYFFPRNPEFKSMANLLLFKNMLLNFGVFYIPMVVLVIVATSNSVNLTDGLDGLAIGLLASAAAAYAVLAYVSGHIKISEYLNIFYIREAGELTVLCAATFGASLGFLWFNSHPASIFMGDVGALPLGGLIGLVAILIKQELLLILVGGVFVIEGGSVLLQIIYFRATKGKRLFKMAPLHHHFELLGWSESKIVVRFWILSFLFVLLALSTLKIR